MSQGGRGPCPGRGVKPTGEGFPGSPLLGLWEGASTMRNGSYAHAAQIPQAECETNQRVFPNAQRRTIREGRVHSAESRYQHSQSWTRGTESFRMFPGCSDSWLGDGAT
jgi:hypothetical protein